MTPDRQHNLDLAAVRFGRGSHPPAAVPTGDRDMCIMEAVAFMAGETWGACPSCACPVIAEFLRVWNDGLPNGDRDRLLRAYVWVPRLIGSRATQPAIEQKRLCLTHDWLIRVNLPAWIEGRSPKAAQRLRSLAEIVDKTTAQRAADAVFRNANEIIQQHGDDNGLPYSIFRQASAAEAAARPLFSEKVDYYLSLSARNMALSLISSGVQRSTPEQAQEITQTLQQSALDLLNRLLDCKDTDGPPHTNKLEEA